MVALDDDPAAVEATRANARANGVGIDVRLADCLRDPLPETALAVANIGAAAVAPLAQPRARGAPDRVGLPRGRPHRDTGPPQRRAARARRVGRGRARAAGYPTTTVKVSVCSSSSLLQPQRCDQSRHRAMTSRGRRAYSMVAVATFSARFLGCKVSHTDVQEVRERLLADGHVETELAEVAVIGTCCVTREAVAKSRKAARRAAGSAQRVYLTGCAASLPGRLRRPPGERRGRRAPERAYARVRRGAARHVRLRDAGHRPRPGPRVREGAGRLRLRLLVLRDPAGARRAAEPPRRPGARRDPPPGRAGPPRGRADRDQPRLLPRPRGRARPRRASCARPGRRRGSRGCGSRPSRSTTSRRRS